jgi:hypothetical protein
MDIETELLEASERATPEPAKKAPRKPRPSEIAAKEAKAAAKKEPAVKAKPKKKKAAKAKKKFVKTAKKQAPARKAKRSVPKKVKKKKFAKKMGKPPLTGPAALTHRLDLRVNRATKARVTAYAKKKEQTISAVVIGLIDKLK